MKNNVKKNAKKLGKRATVLKHTAQTVAAWKGIVHLRHKKLIRFGYSPFAPK